MRSEATAHGNLLPTINMERAKYIKQGMISSIQYLKLFTDPGFAYHSLITHFGQVLFRSFPSSRVAVRVNLLLFVLKDLVRHWKCSQIPSPRMLLLYSVFHKHFFGAISPAVCSLSLSLRRRCLLPTAKPLPSPSPFPAWKHSVSHNLALDKATFLQLSPGSLPNPCLDTPQASSTVPSTAPFQG